MVTFQRNALLHFIVVGYLLFKESSPEMSQDCKWCSRPRFMRKLLPDYVNKPLCEWHEVLLDLCYCFNCVQEYHRLAEELIEQKSELKKVSSVLSAELRYINCLELKIPYCDW